MPYWFREDNNGRNCGREKEQRKAKTKMGEIHHRYVCSKATVSRVAEDRHRFLKDNWAATSCRGYALRRRTPTWQGCQQLTLDAFRTVESLCAITITVLFSIALSIASCTRCSLSASSALVAYNAITASSFLIIITPSLYLRNIKWAKFFQTFFSLLHSTTGRMLWTEKLKWRNWKGRWRMTEEDDVKPSMTIEATPGDGTSRSNGRRKRIINYNRANDVAGNQLLQRLMSPKS